MKSPVEKEPPGKEESHMRRASGSKEGAPVSSGAQASLAALAVLGSCHSPPYKIRVTMSIPEGCDEEMKYRIGNTGHFESSSRLGVSFYGRTHTNNDNDNHGADAYLCLRKKVFKALVVGQHSRSWEDPRGITGSHPCLLGTGWNGGARGQGGIPTVGGLHGQ